VTIQHPLDFVLLLLSVICFLVAIFASRSWRSDGSVRSGETVQPAVRQGLWFAWHNWVAAGLFLWALTVLLATAGVH